MTEQQKKFSNDMEELFRKANKDNITEFAMIRAALVIGGLLNQGYGEFDPVDFTHRLTGFVMYGVDQEDISG